MYCCLSCIELKNARLNIEIRNTFVRSPPATGKVCDITYYIATNPLRRRRRLSHQTQGDIIAKEWLLFILSHWQGC